MTSTSILFVTWDGPDVDYLESLFLPIFGGLRDHGYRFDILQFRWGDAGRKVAAERACGRLGFGYRAVDIWRRAGMIGPLLSALAGGVHVRRAMRSFGSDILMPRSIFPALATLVGGSAGRRPVLMDADGLELDERVEAGGLRSAGLGYRILRDVESQMVRRSTAVMVRTEASRNILVARAGPPIGRERFHIVTNGRDPQSFRPFDEAARLSVRAELDIPADAPLLLYVGSAGARYRTSSIGELALHLRGLRPDTRLLILTGSPEAARSELGDLFSRLDAFTTIMRVPPEAVPRYAAAADAGTAFIKTSFATQGIAPVKIGEYLLCGTPVVGAAAVGSNASAVSEGVFFDESRGLANAARWIVDTVLPARDEFRTRSRAVGVSDYSLDRSVSDYVAALSDINRRNDPAEKAK